MTIEKIIMMYGTSWCFDCKQAKAILIKLHEPYKFIDIDQDDTAAQFVQKINHGNQSVPTIVFPNGKIPVEPSKYELEQAILEKRDGA
jgi:mycoredoxin